MIGKQISVEQVRVLQVFLDSPKSWRDVSFIAQESKAAPNSVRQILTFFNLKLLTREEL